MAPLALVLHLFNAINNWAYPRSETVQDALIMTPPPIPGRKVPVTLGVMSKCPDARDCEAVFDDVLKEVGNMTAVDLAFIGTLNYTKLSLEVACKHGASECALNARELCAATLYPQTQWWPFVQCINSIPLSDLSIPSLPPTERMPLPPYPFPGSPALRSPLVEGPSALDNYGRKFEGEKNVTSCAEENGMNATQLEMCATTGMGKGLLIGNIGRTKAMNITTSCTIQINFKTVCIRDNGEWLDCPNGHNAEDFIEMIKEVYESSKSN